MAVLEVEFLRLWSQTRADPEGNRAMPPPPRWSNCYVTLLVASLVWLVPTGCPLPPPPEDGWLDPPLIPKKNIIMENSYKVQIS